MAISRQLVAVKWRLVRKIGSLRLPRLLRSLAMTRLVVCTAVLTLSLRGGEADVAISRQLVAVKWRLVRKIGSLRLPRPFRPRNDRVDRFPSERTCPFPTVSEAVPASFCILHSAFYIPTPPLNQKRQAQRSAVRLSKNYAKGFRD